MSLPPGIRWSALAHAVACAAIAATASGCAGATPAPVSTATAGGAPATGAPPLIAVLCYHDLSETRGPLQTVTPAFLRDQIRASRAAGWTFVSLAEVIEARDHPERLPARAMVLTFDDGYRSFYDRALPILREERVKATVGIVSSWVDRPPADLPPLMSWEQIREAERSGWAEIASHSHDLHHYETSNPWNDTGPALAVRRWLRAERRYETRDAYRARARADLQAAQRTFRERLGHPVQAILWPYGEHNAMVRELAQQEGFAVTLGLGWREATSGDLGGSYLPRIMVTRNLRFGSDLAWLRAPRGALRAATVNLDDLADPRTDVLRTRVDDLVKRLGAIGATHVFLRVGADSANDGRLLGVYAPNHQAPVRADLWSMVASKLAQKRIQVWLRAPAANLTWAWQAHPEWRLAPASDERGRELAARWPTRLAPDAVGARRAAADFFADLAVYLPLQGVVFEDDAALHAGERPELDADPTGRARADAVRLLTREAQAAVRAWRPDCRFARFLRSDAVTAPVGPGGQVFEDALADGDLIVVGPDDAADPEQWLRTTGRSALRRWQKIVKHAPRPVTGPQAVPPLVFELPWREDGAALDRTPERVAAILAAAKKAGFQSVGLRGVPGGGSTVPARLLEANGTAETPLSAK